MRQTMKKYGLIMYKFGSIIAKDDILCGMWSKGLYDLPMSSGPAHVIKSISSHKKGSTSG